MKPFIITAVLLFLGFSCNDLVEGINEDPNNPTSASYQYVLTGAEVGNIIYKPEKPPVKRGFSVVFYWNRPSAPGVQRIQPHDRQF
ncbi:MAG: hypothetical protein IPN20_04080 [Haliscomenobacter sp.]|nr:hypothetical protein [Haliscomenobacter sp.]